MFWICRKYGEAITVALVFLLTALGGWWYLNQPGIKIRPDATTDGSSFIPALMWATGHGLNQAVSYMPQWQAFLQQEEDSLPFSAVSANIEGRVGGTKFLLDRHYLLYSVGIVWRYFGISWTSVRVFLAGVAALIGILTYGIFRLGMGRILSLIATFLTMTSPVMLAQLPWPRSLCKAPFILAVIWFVGYLLTTRLKPRYFLILSALVGVVIGVGFGFRQDAIIGLPPALAVVTLGARLTSKHHVWYRIIAPILLIASFLVPAWPSLKMTRETGGNNSFYLTQGFAATCFASADMGRAFYTVAYNPGDYAVHALIMDYGYKQMREPVDDFRSLRMLYLAHMATVLQTSPLEVLPDLDLSKDVFAGDDLRIWSRKSELVARQLVRDLYMTFPGDVVGRWYAAVLRVVRNLQTHDFPPEDTPVLGEIYNFYRPLMVHCNCFGHWYALVGLVVLAVYSPWLALCCLLVLLYFCGYTSLEFQIRHGFHLNFFAFWPLFFLLGVVGCVVRSAWKAGPRGIVAAVAAPRRWFLRFVHGVVFVGVVGSILVAMLYGARWYQQRNVNRIYECYRNADLEPVPFSVRERDGKTIYVPERLAGFQDSALEKVQKWLGALGGAARFQRYLRTEYVVVELETISTSPAILWRYENGQHTPRDTYTLVSSTGPQVIRVFIPIFDFSPAFLAVEPNCEFSPFEGVMLESGVTLRNIYRVRNAKDFSLLMTVWLPNDPRQIVWRYELPDLFLWDADAPGLLFQLKKFLGWA